MSRPWLELLDGSPEQPRLMPVHVADRLRAGESVPDAAFDQFMPARLRALALQHWTPLSVSRRIAEWLVELQIRTVVDVGSGAGKFCVAAALAAPHCRFTGVEQRPWLVEAAGELATLFGVEQQVGFVTGRVGELEVPQADAYYLYNPFGENLFDDDSRISDDVELGGVRYQRDVAATARLLASRPSGTYVIKYNGYGGKMPRGYEVVRRDTEFPDLLRLWRRQ